jgi:hypothetical protein
MLKRNYGIRKTHGLTAKTRALAAKKKVRKNKKKIRSSNENPAFSIQLFSII